MYVLRGSRCFSPRCARYTGITTARKSAACGAPETHFHRRALRLAKMPPKQGSRRGSKEDTAPAAAAKPKKVEAPVLTEEEQKLMAATTDALNQLIEQGKDVASELKVRLRSSWS